MQLKAELLAAQLDEHRARLASVDSRGAEQASVVERFAVERDLALTRAAELESILGAAQQALELLDRRLVERRAGDARARRSDRRAQRRARCARERRKRRTADDGERRPRGRRRAPRARRARGDVARAPRRRSLQLSEAHASETAGLEEQLRERARVIAAMDKELGRREQLVRELVVSLEEARDATSTGGPRLRGRSRDARCRTRGGRAAAPEAGRPGPAGRAS